MLDKDNVILTVHEDENGMAITTTNCTSQELWQSIVDLIGVFSGISGVSYNEVCDDLKESEEIS